MKSWERKIVPVGFGVAGLVFVIAGVRPALAGGSLDVTFFLIGVVCAVIAVVAWRKV
jgi:hypothetical protein